MPGGSVAAAADQAAAEAAVAVWQQQQQQQQQQRRGGWFQKCQELSDAVLNGDHDRAMELAYCYRGKKHELEKLEQAQDQGYYSKK